MTSIVLIPINEKIFDEQKKEKREKEEGSHKHDSSTNLDTDNDQHDVEMVGVKNDKLLRRPRGHTLSSERGLEGGMQDEEKG